MSVSLWSGGWGVPARTAPWGTGQAGAEVARAHRLLVHEFVDAQAGEFVDMGAPRLSGPAQNDAALGMGRRLPAVETGLGRGQGVAVLAQWRCDRRAIWWSAELAVGQTYRVDPIRSVRQRTEFNSRDPPGRFLPSRWLRLQRQPNCRSPGRRPLRAARSIGSCARVLPA